MVLDEAESTMNQRVASPLPRDVDSLEHLVIQHKEFETRLQVSSVGYFTNKSPVLLGLGALVFFKRH